MYENQDATEQLTLVYWPFIQQSKLAPLLSLKPLQSPLLTPTQAPQNSYNSPLISLTQLLILINELSYPLLTIKPLNNSTTLSHPDRNTKIKTYLNHTPPLAELQQCTYLNSYKSSTPSLQNSLIYHAANTNPLLISTVHDSLTLFNP